METLNYDSTRENFQLLSEDGLIHKEKWGIWSERINQSKLIEENELNIELLDSFLKNGLFVADNPKAGGLTEKEKRLFTHLLGVFKDNPDYLVKYQLPKIGKPNFIQTKVPGADKEAKVTHRWLKHLYSQVLFDRFLKNRLPDDFVSADVGSSYGIFQHMMHLNKKSHQILIDFPEQLLLANFYLSNAFPDAKICFYKDLKNAEKLSDEALKSYDFILVPISELDRISNCKLDLVTSFACLGELPRDLFNNYVQKLFHAEYFFLINPYAPKQGSQHSGGTDVTILDYPFIDKSKYEIIHFDTSPIYKFGYGGDVFPPFFECIGRKLNG